MSDLTAKIEDKTKSNELGMENKYEKVNEIVRSGTFRKDNTWQRKKSLIENCRKLKMKKTKRIRKRINKK